MVHTIKPHHHLTAAELRELAHTAADNSEPVHEHGLTLTEGQRHQYQSAYVERRHELLAACA